jgi:hypothetical protein
LILFHECLDRVCRNMEDKSPLLSMEIRMRHTTTCTSRKHGKKEPQLFVHCSPVDHHDLHLFNNYNFLFFWFTNWSFRNLGGF